MKHLLFLAALTLGLASAQAVDTKGIPAGGAGAFLYVSVRKLDQSKIGTALDKAFGDEVRANRALASLRDKLGFDLEKDLEEAVVGVAQNPAKANPDLVVVLRGRFDVAKIEAYAKSVQAASRPVGKFTAWNAEDIGRALDAKSQAKTKGGVPFLIPVSADTLIITEEAQVEAAVDAFTGAKPSYQPSQVVAERLAAPTAPFLLVDVDVAGMKKAADTNGVAHALLTVGEVGPDLVVATDLTMINAGKATQFASQVKGMAGMLSIGLMDETNKSADQIAGQRILLELLQSLKSEAKGDHTIIALSYDAEKAALGVIKAVVAQKIKAATGK
jgi:hypothetical protein